MHTNINSSRSQTPLTEMPSENKGLRLTITLLFLLMELDPRILAEIVPNYYSFRYLFIGLLMGLIAFLNYKSLGWSLSVGRWPTLLTFLALYQIASAFWSANVLLGLFFGFCFLTAVLSAMAVGWRLELSEVIACYINATLIACVLGIFVAIAVPSIGQEEQFLNAGDWRGLANQKNLFGYFAALAAVFVGLRLFYRGMSDVVIMPKGRAILLLGIFLYSTVMSASRGAAAVALSACVIALLLAVPVKRSQWLIFLGLLFASTFVIVGLTTSVEGGDLAIMGIPINSSNRLTLWLYGLTEMEGSEVFGLGRSGFWTNLREHNFLVVNGWVLSNFHNAYVTILIEGGIVGFLLLIMCLVAIALSLGMVFASSPHKDATLGLSLFISFLLYCTVEAVIGRTTTMAAYFTFIVVMSVTARHWRESRNQPEAAASRAAFRNELRNANGGA